MRPTTQLQRTFLPVFSCACVLFVSALLFVPGCQKVDAPAIQNDVLDPATTAAFKWWYDSFLGSAAYSRRNRTSFLAAPAGYSDEKYPRWTRVRSYQKGELAIVEVPLVYETNSVFLPGMQSLHKTPEGDRVAKSVVHKLVILKNWAGPLL